MGIKSIRIFPPLAVARLGSSLVPLENYELEIPDAVSPRKIVPAMTLLVDEDGNVSEKRSTGSVAFRDREGLIHPVAPFFELWAQMEFFDEGTAVIARDIAEPGALTQSLCAPWQNDYRECSCFYWAASRPDFVNVEVGPNGAATGNNWMQKDRTAATPKVYINDDWMDDRLLSHTDLIQSWETLLRFIVGNRDESPVQS